MENKAPVGRPGDRDSVVGDFRSAQQRVARFHRQSHPENQIPTAVVLHDARARARARARPAEQRVLDWEAGLAIGSDQRAIPCEFSNPRAISTVSQKISMEKRLPK
jgi:hypothetical protein